MHGPSRGSGASFGGGAGGGFSSSGSSFGGSTFNASFGGPRPPRHLHFFGRTIILTSGKMSLFIFMIVALIISGFFCFFGASNYSDLKKDIGYYQSDEIGYKDLIEKANQNVDGYYIKDFDNIDFEFKALVSVDAYNYYNCFVYTTFGVTLVANYCLDYDDIAYFQIVYHFEDEGRVVNGLTYACYKDTEVATMSEFSVAYHYAGGKTVDSINIDYDIEKNMDYADALDSYSSAKTILIISSVILGVIVVVIILLIVVTVKKAKRDNELEEQKIQSEIDKTEAETEQVKAETQRLNRVCEYCGNPIPPDVEVCPSCGSRKSKK